MVQSQARTVTGYLASLPKERRDVIAALRAVIRRHLPKGYREVMNWGAITYEVPLRRHPDTYNGKPLAYACLAAQKNYFALYLLGAYQDPAQAKKLEAAFERGRQEARHGQVLRPLQEPRRPGPGRGGRGHRRHSGRDVLARYETSRRRTAGRGEERRA